MTAKSKSEMMAKMRAERAAAGLRRVQLWVPATAAVERALKRLEAMDGDSIAALVGDNTCPACGEYSPFSERNGPDAPCPDCSAAEYRKMLNT
jgi:hypothetical protein